jgi:hypothetical protein
MAVDLTVGPGLGDDLAHRDGAQTKGAQAADRRLLEQERGAAHRDQIEEALMDLDREVRTIEVGLHGLSDPIQGLGHGTALDRAHFPSGDQAEPLRPGRRQLREQRGAELLDGI